MACAAVAAGADALMLEMHPNPREAKSDAAQSLTPDVYRSLMEKLQAYSALSGRPMKKGT
jgi:3-deoxy-7-phosphoheptulonate synthase